MRPRIDDVLDSPAHPVSDVEFDPGSDLEHYVATRVLAALIIADSALDRPIAAECSSAGKRQLLICLAADYTEDLLEELYRRGVVRQHRRNEEVKAEREAAASLLDKAEPDMPDA